MKKTVKDMDVREKRVLVRNDFNVPLKGGEVGDDTRIREALPTLRHLVDQNARVVLCSHLGRPKGEPTDELRLDPVARRLSHLLGRNVDKQDDCIGEAVDRAKEMLKPGEVILLENTRFHPGEKKNDPDFAASLARGFDLFVNDAFGAAHRAHASTEGVGRHLPSVAGLLMAREIEVLTPLLEAPKTPLAAIFGGAKIADKIGVIERFLDTTQTLLVGGGMANMFFKVKGVDIGKSFVDETGLSDAETVLNKAGDRLILPIDVVITDRIEEGAEHRTVPVDDIPGDWRIVDIGAETVAMFSERLKGSRTVIWNGPLGVFETPPFDRGTRVIAQVLTQLDAETYIGGGDSASAVNQANLADKVTHVSTGGGAFLEFMEGKTLPGVAILADK